MAQTKHRSFHPDNHLDQDEVEQKLHVKDYRKARHEVSVELDDEDEFVDNPHYADVEYFLSKYK